MKTGHVSRYCPTKAKAPKTEVNKDKEKVDVEHIKAEMKRHGKGEMDQAHPMEGSLHLRGQVITPHSIKHKKDTWG